MGEMTPDDVAVQEQDAHARRAARLIATATMLLFCVAVLLAFLLVSVFGLDRLVEHVQHSIHDSQG